MCVCGGGGAVPIILIKLNVFKYVNQITSLALYY